MVHATRVRERCLFAATHLAAFFSRRLPEFARSANAHFDFILQSRLRRPPPTDHAALLTLFLKLGLKYRLPCLDLASVMASAILMEAYPIHMHGKAALLQ